MDDFEPSGSGRGRAPRTSWPSRTWDLQRGSGRMPVIGKTLRDLEFRVTWRPSADPPPEPRSSETLPICPAGRGRWSFLGRWERSGRCHEPNFVMVTPSKGGGVSRRGRRCRSLLSCRRRLTPGSDRGDLLSGVLAMILLGSSVGEVYRAIAGGRCADCRPSSLGIAGHDRDRRLSQNQTCPGRRVPPHPRRLGPATTSTRHVEYHRRRPPGPARWLWQVRSGLIRGLALLVGICTSNSFLLPTSVNAL